jgi:hypothetical protein
MTASDEKLDGAAIEQEIALLHELATRSNVRGKLILAGYGQDPLSGKNLRAVVQPFALGNAKAMTTQALRFGAERHRNIYMPLALMREDLPRSRKGSEADVVAVLGIVADFDGKADGGAEDWRFRLPMPPSMVLRTSHLPHASYQCRYLFTQPISGEEAKRLAKLLTKFSGCDSASADISHVWRIAGGLNSLSSQSAAGTDQTG